MITMDKIKQQPVAIGTLIALIPAIIVSWNFIRPRIVLAEDLEDVRQEYSEAIDKNTQALMNIQRYQLMQQIRDVSREIARLEVRRENGDWDEEYAEELSDLNADLQVLQDALDEL